MSITPVNIIEKLGIQGVKDSREMLKVLIKSLENKHLNPGILESFLATKGKGFFR